MCASHHRSNFPLASESPQKFPAFRRTPNQVNPTPRSSSPQLNQFSDLQRYSTKYFHRTCVSLALPDQIRRQVPTQVNSYSSMPPRKSTIPLNFQKDLCRPWPHRDGSVLAESPLPQCPPSVSSPGIVPFNPTLLRFQSWSPKSRARRSPSPFPHPVNA